jgi:hypothetical protein
MVAFAGAKIGSPATGDCGFKRERNMRLCVAMLALMLFVGLTGCQTGEKSMRARTQSCTCALCGKESTNCKMCYKCSKCSHVAAADDMDCRCTACKKEFSCSKCMMKCPNCKHDMMSGTKMLEASESETRTCTGCGKTVMISAMKCECPHCKHEMGRADMMGCTKCDGGMMASAGMCCPKCRAMHD